MSDLNKQIQREGLDYIQIAISVAVILSLVFAATFCHAKASRAQVVDPMPILTMDTVYLPQVTR